MNAEKVTVPYLIRNDEWIFTAKQLMLVFYHINYETRAIIHIQRNISGIEEQDKIIKLTLLIAGKLARMCVLIMQIEPLMSKIKDQLPKIKHFEAERIPGTNLLLLPAPKV